MTADQQTAAPATTAGGGASVAMELPKPATLAQEQAAAEDPTRRPVFVDGGSPAKTPAKAPAARRSPAKRKENSGTLHLHMLCVLE